MKKILIVLSLIISLSSLNAQAQMDPKAKAVGTMALYGTVGGALLGTASLAFGAGGRSVAIGASLGLYAGLLFGGYVVGSYSLKSKGYFKEKPEGYYPDTEASPYQDSESMNYNPGEGQGGASIDFDLAPKDFVLQGQVYYVEVFRLHF